MSDHFKGHQRVRQSGSYNLRQLNYKLCDAVCSLRNSNQNERSFAEESDGCVCAMYGPNRISKIVHKLNVCLHDGHQRRELILVTVSRINWLSGIRQDKIMFRLTSP